ncbi:MAG: hypothetical protein ACKVX7_06490 [Planctomycetota bacterium]
MLSRTVATPRCCRPDADEEVRARAVVVWILAAPFFWGLFYFAYVILT